MSLIKPPAAITAAGLLLTAAITALLLSEGYFSFEWVPIIAIGAMGLLFTLNLGLMLWPGIKKAHSDGTSLWKVLMKVMLVLLFLSIPLLGGLGIFLFFVIFIINAMLTSRLSRFLKLQAMLPNSKIRSLAMGLVELQGKVIARERLNAPLSRRPCIGYYYCVHRESRDKDGKNPGN